MVATATLILVSGVLSSQLVAAAAQPATNWALATLGAAATANSAGYWAGYTAEPAYAVDGDELSFWSSTGGATCCTESAPAWLQVALGGPQPVAAVQVVYEPDMSFSLALGNASGGPWATVATYGCLVCKANEGSWGLLGRTVTAVLPASITASHARLTITWSSKGGVGGCDDVCDFATSVNALRVWGAGELPATAPEGCINGDCITPYTPPAAAAPAAGCTTQRFLPNAFADEVALLTGDAALSAPGSGFDSRSRSTQLTAAQAPGSAGAAEFPAIIRPPTDCPCSKFVYDGGFLLTAWVKLGGGVVTGEGLAISIVDASKQTPGKTVYMRGCGVTPALPAHAISIVLDTASSDPACDAPGAGVRIVSTLAGQDAPPLVLGAALEQGTASFRQGGWVPIQVAFSHMPLASGEGQAAQPLLVTRPQFVLINGTQVLSGASVLVLHAAELRAANATLDALYLVVSARTGAIDGGDAHSVSGVRVECANGDSNDEFMASSAIINWEGLRQPYTPPRSYALPPAPAPALLSHAQRGVGPSAAVACACAFALTLAAMAAAAEAWQWHRGRRAARRQPDVGEAASLKEEEADSDVFLLCSAEDLRLADAVHAKLRLAGLHVRVAALAPEAERSAGLDADVLRALRAARVFAPLVTLPLLQRVARAAAATQPDAVLAVWLAALHCRDGAAAGAASPRLRAIRPLLVGSTLPGASPPQWSNLLLEPEYGGLLAALPDAAPAASAAALDAALRRAGAPPLQPRFAALTVRDIVLGGAAADDAPAAAAAAHATRGGILAGGSDGTPPFSLACAHDDLGLYLRDRYVKLLRADLLLDTHV